MQKNTHFISVSLIVAHIFLVLGCSSPPPILQRVEEIKALPSEIPKEVQRDFEVQELSSSALAQPSPVSAASKSSSKDKLKKSKKDLQPVSAPSVAPASAEEIYVNRRPKSDPKWVGEKMIFDISYFGMGGGTMTLEVLPHKMIGGRKVYHFKGLAESSKVFSLFYRVNDTVESYLDYESLVSHRLHILVDESKQSRDALELNDPVKKQTFFWNRWNHFERGYSETKEFAPIPSNGQDTFSALYYIRTLPLEMGKIYTFPIVSEAKHFDGIVTVLKKDYLDSPLGTVPVLKLKLDAKLGGVLQNRGDSFMYVTDDEFRYPVLLEAKVKIGTIQIKLASVLPGQSI